jgi:hypothetical protein
LAVLDKAAVKDCQYISDALADGGSSLVKRFGDGCCQRLPMYQRCHRRLVALLDWTSVHKGSPVGGSTASNLLAIYCRFIGSETGVATRLLQDVEWGHCLGTHTSFTASPISLLTIHDLLHFETPSYCLHV